jgi:predicted transcriptional regulator
LQTRLSFDLEPELITFLVENSYIEKNEQAGQDYLMLSPKGRSFLQCKMDLVE